MKENLNLAPLEELLTTCIGPQDLAEKLDEIFFDYVKAIISLHLKTKGDSDAIHNETINYLFHIHELKRALRKCGE